MTRPSAFTAANTPRHLRADGAVRFQQPHHIPSSACSSNGGGYGGSQPVVGEFYATRESLLAAVKERLQLVYDARRITREEFVAIAKNTFRALTTPPPNAHTLPFGGGESVAEEDPVTFSTAWNSAAVDEALRLQLGLLGVMWPPGVHTAAAAAERASRRGSRSNSINSNAPHYQPPHRPAAASGRSHSSATEDGGGGGAALFSHRNDDPNRLHRVDPYNNNGYADTPLGWLAGHGTRPPSPTHSSNNNAFTAAAVTIGSAVVASDPSTVLASSTANGEGGASRVHSSHSNAAATRTSSDREERLQRLRSHHQRLALDGLLKESANRIVSAAAAGIVLHSSGRAGRAGDADQSAAWGDASLISRGDVSAASAAGGHFHTQQLSRQQQQQQLAEAIRELVEKEAVFRARAERAEADGRTSLQGLCLHRLVALLSSAAQQAHLREQQRMQQEEEEKANEMLSRGVAEDDADELTCDAPPIGIPPPPNALVHTPLGSRGHVDAHHPAEGVVDIKEEEEHENEWAGEEAEGEEAEEEAYEEEGVDGGAYATTSLTRPVPQPLSYAQMAFGRTDHHHPQTPSAAAAAVIRGLAPPSRLTPDGLRSLYRSTARHEQRQRAAAAATNHVPAPRQQLPATPLRLAGLRGLSPHRTSASASAAPKSPFGTPNANGKRHVSASAHQRSPSGGSWRGPQQHQQQQQQQRVLSRDERALIAAAEGARRAAEAAAAMAVYADPYGPVAVGPSVGTTPKRNGTNNSSAKRRASPSSISTAAAAVAHRQARRPLPPSTPPRVASAVAAKLSLSVGPSPSPRTPLRAAGANHSRVPASPHRTTTAAAAAASALLSSGATPLLIASSSPYLQSSAHSAVGTAGGTHYPSRDAIVDHVRALLQPAYNSGLLPPEAFAAVVRHVSAALGRYGFPSGERWEDTVSLHVREGCALIGLVADDDNDEDDYDGGDGYDDGGATYS